MARKKGMNNKNRKLKKKYIYFFMEGSKNCSEDKYIKEYYGEFQDKATDIGFRFISCGDGSWKNIEKEINKEKRSVCRSGRRASCRSRARLRRISLKPLSAAAPLRYLRPSWLQAAESVAGRGPREPPASSRIPPLRGSGLLRACTTQREAGAEFWPHCARPAAPGLPPSERRRALPGARGRPGMLGVP